MLATFVGGWRVVPGVEPVFAVKVEVEVDCVAAETSDGNAAACA